MNPSRRTRPYLLGSLAVAAALAFTLVAAGCSSGGGEGSVMSDQDAGTLAAPEAGTPEAPLDGDSAAYSAEQGTTTASGSDTSKTAEPARDDIDLVSRQAVIRTGELALETDDPAATRAGVLSIARSLSATVADERSGSDDGGRLEQVDLTLRVPVSSFDVALDRLSKLGTVTDRSQAAEDVTTQVIDTDARVKAQAASVASIQRLLARATTIGEIMSIEGQLTRRQAELDSLVQQQRYLKDQTALSTLHVSVSRTEDDSEDSQAAGGFLGGLEDGWNALGDSATAVGTAVGAALPFAALFALIGSGVWLVLRRTRQGRQVRAEAS